MGGPRVSVRWARTFARFSPAWRCPVKNNAIRHPALVDTMPEVKIPLRAEASGACSGASSAKALARARFPISARIFIVGRVEDWRGDGRCGLSGAPRFLVGVPH